MTRRSLPGAASCGAIAVFAALAAPACNASSVSCEQLSQRNATCADAFAAYARGKAREGIDEQIVALPPAERAKAEERLERRFEKAAIDVRKTLTSNEFLVDCRASWSDPAKMPNALKKELQRCVELPDCDAYAACFMEAERASKPDGG